MKRWIVFFALAFFVWLQFGFAQNVVTNSAISSNPYNPNVPQIQLFSAPGQIGAEFETYDSSGNPVCYFDSSGMLSSNCRGTAGSTTIQTNGTNNSLQTLLNFVNPASFNGLSFTFQNTSGGIETFALSGSLGVGGGGTGFVSATANGLIYGNGTSALGVTAAPTTAGTILYFNGTNWVLLNGNTGSSQCLTESSAGAPSWGACGGGSSAWSAITGSSTNTNTGFVLAPAATGVVPWTENAPTGITSDVLDWNLAGTNYLNIVDASGVLVLNPANGGFIDANRSRWGSVNVEFNPGGPPASGQCLGYDGTYISGVACGGGSGLPSSWTVGSGNTVTAAPTTATDTTTLTIAPSLASGGTYNIAQIGNSSLTTPQVGCTANVYFAVEYNGNLCFSASNLQLSTTGAAPYLYLNDIKGNPGQPYLQTSTAYLTAPVLGTLTSGSGSLSGATYVEITYVNSAGETTKSNEQTITLAASSSLIVPAAAAESSAFGYQIYVDTTSGGETLRVPTSSNCALSTSTFGGNAVCAIGATATFATLPAAGSAPPASNTTGGAYITDFAPAANGLGMFVSNGAPGADAPVGAGLSLPGGTGLNLTSGTTTTAGTLACLSGSEMTSQCASNPASGVFGVFVSSGQNALVQTSGIATINLASASTTTYNHFACASTSGTIVDSSTACSGVQQIGIIAQTNAVNVTSVPVFLMTQGAGGGGAATVASGTAALGTSAIASGACASTVTVPASGVATTDVISTGFNGDPTSVTGYGVSATGAVLTIYPYPTSGNVNFKVCNSTPSSITPGAMTLNWRVTR